MSTLVLPDARLEMPALLYPKRKPVGRVKIDWSHPIARHAFNILLFNGDKNPLRNQVDGSLFTANTAYGSTEYQLQPIADNLAFARQDIDEAGISYYGKPSGVLEVSNPCYTIIIYTVLAAPTGANKGVFQREVGGAPRSGNPVYLLRSNSNTELKYYADGSDIYTGIPVQVGKKHILIHRDNGDGTNEVYDSAKGTWETVNGGDTSKENALNVDWLGTGYTAELPVAFELFISGQGSAPSLQELKEFSQNPYQFLEPE